MMKKRWLALLVCLVMLSVGCQKKKEDTYQGKPLSTWIEMLRDKQNPAQRYAAVNAVIEMGPEAKEAIPALIDMIREVRNVDKRLLFACNKALLGMGKEIIPNMTALLKDDNWEMRRGAAWTLGKLGPEGKDAIPALTEALNDTNAEVRMKAKEALKRIKGEKEEKSEAEKAAPESEKAESPSSEEK